LEGIKRKNGPAGQQMMEKGQINQRTGGRKGEGSFDEGSVDNLKGASDINGARWNESLESLSLKVRLKVR
jgi:hypothetical protein